MSRAPLPSPARNSSLTAEPCLPSNLPTFQSRDSPCRTLQPGVHALIRFDLRRSISQRPPGPGGVSVLNTADIAMTR
jgi:hypothetical protein